MLFRRSIVAMFLFGGISTSAGRAQDDAQIQQYVQMLQPVMWQELNFIRQTCDLTPEQRPKIRADADVAVKEGAKAILQPQRANINGVPIMRSQPTFGAQAIRDNLHETLKKTLTSEQLERYETEDAKRVEATRQATMLTAVARLDDALLLSQEQREKLLADLDKNWQREWEQWLAIYRYSGQYVPQVPDQYVTPLLNDEQKLIWGSIQKISTNAWFNDGQEQKEDPWWNPKGIKAAKAEAKPPGKAAFLNVQKE